MKFKRKVRKIIKKHQGETYFFNNNVAKVPGMFHQNGKQYTITLREFNELTGG